jgi:ribonuclease P protein component
MVAGASQNPESPLRYSKEYRLLKHADYDRVYKQGRRHFSPLMTFFFLERETSGSPRVGITVGRALGGAVVRNRIKRRMREAVRASLAEFADGLALSADVVINPKKNVLTAEFDKIGAEVTRGFAQVRKQLAIAAAQRQEAR